MATRQLADLQKFSQQQLKTMRKEELIQCILSAPEVVEDVSHEVASKLSALIVEVAEIRKSLTSPDSPINKQVRLLQEQVAKQQDVIVRQQRFLEDIDRKAGECNLMLLGIPEEQESLNGAVAEDAKIQKALTTIGSSVKAHSSRRLGKVGQRRRPILITVASRED